LRVLADHLYDTLWQLSCSIALCWHPWQADWTKQRALNMAGTKPRSRGVVQGSPLNGSGIHVDGDMGGTKDNTDIQGALLPQLAMRCGISEEEVKKCYKIFIQCDKDNTGHVSFEELRTLLTEVSGEEMSQEEFGNVVLSFDSNNDGMVHFEEFVIAFCHTPGKIVGTLKNMIEKMGEETREAMEMERLTASERVLKIGVLQSNIKDYLRAELYQMQACLQLPISIAVFASFALAVLLHERVDILHALDKSIKYDLEENANFAFSGNVPFQNGRMGHKTIYDVNSIADFWSWLNLGVVPLLWAEGWDLNEVRTNLLSHCQSLRSAFSSFGFKNLTGLRTAPGLSPCPEDGKVDLESMRAFYGVPRTPTYLYFNAILGGVRLRQEYSETSECPSSSAWSRAVHSGYCVHSNDYWLMPEVFKALYTHKELLDRPKGKTVHLPSRISQSQIRQELRKLEDAIWLSPHTSKVEVMIPTYNPHVNALTATFLLFFFSIVGDIFTKSSNLCPCG